MTSIYTVGYEGAEIRAFVDHLLAAGIELLADVRAVPLSRKPGFSKKALREAVEAVGITYLHFPHLGDPKEGREAARAGDFNEFRRIFAAHLQTAEAETALVDLSALAQELVTCLMCFERDPEVCHRSIVASRLADRGMIVSHLHGDSSNRSPVWRQSRSSRDPNQGRSAAE